MLKSKKFWAYRPCQAYEMNEELFDNYKVKGRFYEDVLFFYDHMGIAPHPALRMPVNREVTEVNSISLINSKVDINTLKILIHLLPYTRIISLKFCSNDFDITNFEFLITSLISKQNNIYYLSIEWNDKLTIDEQVYSRMDNNEQFQEKFQKQSELIKSLFSQTKFESICLRGNHLCDDTVIEIFNILSNSENDSQLKVLSLYNNNLTSKCIDSFCEMLLKNRKLEEVNFGNNNITDDDIEKIKDHTGIFPMTKEEVDAYNKKFKEREAIIAKNVKLKQAKKPELEVPYLDTMEQIEDKFYIVKNNTIKIFNFMMNSLTEKCFDNIIYMLDYNENLKITLDDNVFNKEQKEIIADRNKTYYNRVYFSKC